MHYSHVQLRRVEPFAYLVHPFWRSESFGHFEHGLALPCIQNVLPNICQKRVLQYVVITSVTRIPEQDDDGSVRILDFTQVLEKKDEGFQKTEKGVDEATDFGGVFGRVARLHHVSKHGVELRAHERVEIVDANVRTIRVRGPNCG